MTLHLRYLSVFILIFTFFSFKPDIIKGLDYQTPQDSVYSLCDIAPKFKNSNQELLDFIKLNLKYPTTLLKQGMQDINASVNVVFIVNKQGKIEYPSIINKRFFKEREDGTRTKLNLPDSLSAEFVYEAIRVTESMPDWMPGTKNGQPVNAYFYINYQFKYVPKQERLTPKDSTEDITYIIVEEMPQFVGGVDSLKVYLNRYKYCPSEYLNSYLNVVYVRFDVNKQGIVWNTSLVRSSGSSFLDQKALNIVEDMPKWIPGRQAGKLVSVSYTLPIYFEKEKRKRKNTKP